MLAQQAYDQQAQASGTGFLIALLLLLVCGAAVYFDAKAIGARKGLTSGMAGTSPGVWAFGVIAMWIVVFPLYLLTRRKIKAAAQQASRRSDYGYARPQQTWRQAADQQAAWQQPHGYGSPAQAPTQASMTPPAGWYLDPERPEYNRWWDGNQWTEHRTQKPY